MDRISTQFHRPLDTKNCRVRRSIALAKLEYYRSGYGRAGSGLGQATVANPHIPSYVQCNRALAEQGSGKSLYG